jgi:hypothetical protein
VEAARTQPLRQAVVLVVATAIVIMVWTEADINVILLLLPDLERLRAALSGITSAWILRQRGF